jgi:hypothetical protein
MVSNNEERDERARRALDEARSLIEKRPERYVYKAPPRALYLDDEPEPAPFEPEPDDASERRGLDTAPRSAADPWAPWEAWVTARIETHLNAALAIEREELKEIIAHVIATERERAGAAWRDQVAGLRADLTRTEAVREQLRRLVEIERARTIDIPALPLSRHEVN